MLSTKGTIQPEQDFNAQLQPHAPDAGKGPKEFRPNDLRAASTSKIHSTRTSSQGITYSVASTLISPPPDSDCTGTRNLKRVNPYTAPKETRVDTKRRTTYPRRDISTIFGLDKHWADDRVTDTHARDVDDIFDYPFIEAMAVPPVRSIRIGDSLAIWKFYAQQFRSCQQIACKLIAKAWVKAMNLKKQSYSGRVAKVPDWWPKECEMPGYGYVRYIEPDHLNDKELIYLLIHILRLVVKSNASQHSDIKNGNLNICKLQQITTEALTSFFLENKGSAQTKVCLGVIFDTAILEERHCEGKIVSDNKNASLISPDNTISKEPQIVRELNVPAIETSAEKGENSNTTKAPIQSLPEFTPVMRSDNSAASIEQINVFRQIAIANVQIHIVSLSNTNTTTDAISNAGDESDSSMDDIGYDKEEARDSDESESIATDAGKDTSINESKGISNTISSSKLSQGDKRGDSNQNGRRGNGQKRSRKEPPTDENGLNLARFACPYQVYETSLGCFRRGPRNPRGGCNGIARLKQHLNRRHVQSNRCQQCWISFESKQKAIDHRTEATCEPKSIPEGEWLMTIEQENIIGNFDGRMKSEEDIWWWMFQQLIPGMNDCTLNLLKQQYWPYYHNELAMTLPPMNLWGLSFSESTTSNPNIRGLTPALCTSSTSSISEIFPVPIYERNSFPCPPPDSLSMDLSDKISVAARLTPTDSSSNSVVSDNIFTAPISSSTTPISIDSRSVDQLPLRRAYERLQARNSQLLSENTELREAKRSSRVDLEAAESILDAILAAGRDVIPFTDLYENLEKISDILLGIEQKLR